MSELTKLLMILTVIITPIAGWITHIVTCFQQELWGFLVAGAILVPVGVLHGIYIWFT